VTALSDAPRRRHRWRNALIALVIVLALLVVAALVADGVVRKQEASVVESGIRTSLAIPASTPVDVTVGGTSAILQYLSGKLERVDVAVPSLTIGGFAGAASLTAQGISTGTAGSVDSAKLVFSTDQNGLKKLLAGVSSVNIRSVSIASGAIKIGTTVSVIGLKVPVAAALTPSAVDGKLLLTPRSFVVNGATIPAADLRGRFGEIADSLTKTQTICVADQLPRALALDSAAVSGSSLVLGVSAKSLVLNSDLFASKGTCPGQ
jgi:hypothetical protein